jgi:hypothetical protein
MATVGTAFEAWSCTTCVANTCGASGTAPLLPQVVEFVIKPGDLIGDVAVIGFQVPRARKSGDLHGVAQVHQLIEQLSALEYCEHGRGAHIQVVVCWNIREDADPAIELSQGELVTANTDYQVWNFQRSPFNVRTPPR